jgi:hypothetical protein
MNTYLELLGFQGLSLGINHLIEIGETLCEACDEIENPVLASSSNAINKIPSVGDNTSVTVNDSKAAADDLARYQCKTGPFPFPFLLPTPTVQLPFIIVPILS